VNILKTKIMKNNALSKGIYGFIFLFLPLIGFSQFDVGADLVSRYLWRGQLLANGPAIQPYVSFSTGDKVGIEIGAWGSYGTASGNDGTEADLYVSLTTGSLTFTLTDYFFPSDNPFADEDANDEYLDYGSGTGHVWEIGASIDQMGKVPLSLGVYYNFAGADDDNSIYCRLGYMASDNLELHVEAGHGWYTLDSEGEKDKFDITCVGLTYTKEIPITEKFSIPIFGTFAVNPNLEKPYIIFGISL